MNQIKLIIGYLSLYLLVVSCSNPGCYDISVPGDFTVVEYSKFPIFNQLLTRDTAIIRYKDTKGVLYNFIYVKGKVIKGFNHSKALKSNSTFLFGKTSDCQRESYINQDAFLAKKVDSTGYVAITISRCKTIENAPNPCPDTVQFASPNRFVGDTIINGRNYSGVRALNQNDFGSYSLVSVNDEVIYLKLTASGKEFWKVP